MARRNHGSSTRSGFTLVELVVIVVVVLAVLVALVVPALVEAHRTSKINQCMSNLKQIGTLSEVYRKSFGGEGFDLPSERGGAWLIKIRTFLSDNQDNSVFKCPAAGTAPDVIDYRGPKAYEDPSSRYPRFDIPILADKCPGGKTQHYGDNKKYGVNALAKGANSPVRESDPRWPDVGPDSPYLQD